MIARWFWREWRSPSLLIVWLALSLAVACVLALGNISDRMEKGLSQQSREFMAGDRALRSSREVPQAWLEEAQKRGLKVGKQLTFATMTKRHCTDPKGSRLKVFASASVPVTPIASEKPSYNSESQTPI